LLKHLALLLALLKELCDRFLALNALKAHLLAN